MLLVAGRSSHGAFVLRIIAALMRMLRGSARMHPLVFSVTPAEDRVAIAEPRI
ncbi:MAG: hypothetical protein OHK0015_30430 [Chloroflexi bacterium OHK40]